MKNIALLFNFFCLMSYSQELQNLVIPKGYTKIAEAKGDIDKDGIDELVYVYNTTSETKSDDPEKNIGFSRELYICKIVGGKTKLWHKNTSVIRGSRDCGFCYEGGTNPKLTIKNNTINIEQTFYSNSRHTQTNTNIFRFQNKDWYLIGATSYFFDTCEFEENYDVNFSTKKATVSHVYGDCDDGSERKIPKDEYYKFTIPLKEIPKMDGFVVGANKFKIPNTKNEYFYY
jgi:hypothetical protein